MSAEVCGAREAGRAARGRGGAARRVRAAAFALLALACLAAGGCREAGLTESVRPRALRDVPAERLAFRFEPDVPAENVPELKDEEATEPPEGIREDFKRRRPDDALMRVVMSPEGQRALVLYATGDTNSVDFRIDLYSAEGAFLRDVLPQNIVGRYDSEVAWTPDGQQIAFIGIRNPSLQPTPTPTPLPAGGAATPQPGVTPPPGELPVAPEGVPSPTVGPLIPPVQVFATEQVYVADRDGFQIKPLTTREGLIYFQLAWAPDAHAIAALASKEQELYARLDAGLPPAGRPRIITLDGQERLLDDRPSDAPPVWSPDASKVAAAFDTDIAVYDAAGGAPTAAGIPLREPLLAASVEYDARLAARQNAAAAANAQAKGSKANAAAPNNTAAANSAPTAATGGGSSSLSFNPVIRLEWTEPETLYVQTAFVRLYRNVPPIRNYPRWHVLHLSPQAALVS